jgi:SPP1 gp7 family putative phage head morphogenesis protein
MAKTTTPPTVNPEMRDRLLSADSGAVALRGVLGILSRTVPGYFLQEVKATASTSYAYGYCLTTTTQFWDLLDEMVDRDSNVASNVALLIAKVLERERCVVVPEEFEEDPRVHDARLFLEDMIAHTNFEYLLWCLLYGTIVHGFSAVEMMWTVLPDLSARPSEFFHAHPGQFAFDRAGLPYYIKDVGVPVAVPPLKFTIMRNPGPFDNPFGQSLLFGLRWLWYFKKKALVSVVRFAEKFGFPLLHGELPSTESTNTKLKDALKNALAQAAEDDCLVTSNGEKVTAINRSAGTTNQPHMLAVDYFDNEITKGILGATLVSNVSKFGTQALGTVHKDTVNSRVLPLARLLESVITDQIFRPLVQLNFGVDCPVPSYDIDTEEGRDAAEGRETLKAAVELGLDVAEAEAREILGLRSPKPGEDLLEPPEKPAPVYIPSGQQPSPVPPGGPGKEPGDKPAMPEQEPVDEEGMPTMEESSWLVRLRKGLGRGEALALFGDSSAKAASFRSAYLKAGRAIELRALALRERLEGSLGAELAYGMKAATKDFAKRVREAGPHDAKIPLRLEHAFETATEKTTDFLAQAIWVSRIVATLTLHKHRKGAASFAASCSVASFAEQDLEAWLAGAPDDFASAVDWMMSREAMSKDQLKALAAKYSKHAGVSLEEAERKVRERAIALARSGSNQATEKVREFVAKAIQNGESLGDFLKRIDAMAEAGEVPGGIDSYWQNVMRTEMSEAYSEQQRQEEKEIGQFMWGHVGCNPNDSRSRPTHASIDGVQFKEGSQASHILGWPPYSFQCRCSLSPIIDPNPQASAFTEDPSALSIATGIERF